jgi:hypothetical protein
MFWKKPSETEAAGSGPSSSREDDAALDTVASLLRSFGNNAFDTDNVTAAETRTECEGWAQRITVGCGKGEKTRNGEPFRRDYGGAHRYLPRNARMNANSSGAAWAFA